MLAASCEPWRSLRDLAGIFAVSCWYLSRARPAHRLPICRLFPQVLMAVAWLKLMCCCALLSEAATINGLPILSVQLQPPKRQLPEVRHVRHAPEMVLECYSWFAGAVTSSGTGANSTSE